MALESVLVVEDEALLLDLIAAELEDAGLTVIKAMTAETALDLLRGDARVDLLFTDIRLPGPMDGWQLGEETRRLRPEIKIIYATGFSLGQPRPTSGSMFFTKPYRPAAILAAMRSLACLPPERPAEAGSSLL